MGYTTKSGAIAILAIAGLVITGCGGSDEPAPGTTGATATSAAGITTPGPSSKPPLDANGLPTTDIVRQAVTATRQLSAVHVKLSVDPGIKGLPVRSVDATVQKLGEVEPGGDPEGVAAKGTAEITLNQNDTYVETQFVMIDNSLYAKVPPATKYALMGMAGEKGVYDPSVILDNGKGLVNVLDNIGDLKVIERAKLGAVDVVKVTGTVDGKTLDPLLPNITEVLSKGGATGAIPVTLWITDKKGDNTATPLVAKMEITMKDKPIVLELSDYDQKVEISKPAT